MVNAPVSSGAAIITSCQHWRSRRGRRPGAGRGGGVFYGRGWVAGCGRLVVGDRACWRRVLYVSPRARYHTAAPALCAGAVSRIQGPRAGGTRAPAGGEGAGTAVTSGVTCPSRSGPGLVHTRPCSSVQGPTLASVCTMCTPPYDVTWWTQAY